MKFLSEYRDRERVEQLLHEISRVTTRPWKIMEVCGGQTHGLVKNGILEMLPEKITMVHGPGCPVCVTPASVIDEAIEISKKENVVLASFGDMIRVPGTKESLLQAKARGADVRVVYSPLDAIQIAQQEKDKQIVFFGVGFESTAPAIALSVIQAKQLGLTNYFVLASHVLVPPAMEALLSDPENTVDAFLAAGHVCTIMGEKEYYPIAEKYHTPIVITGFEPVDLLQGILMAVQQLENGEAIVQNQYSRMVQTEGNASAQSLMKQVFETCNREWRGIGTIPLSGLEVNEDYSAFDARRHFSINFSSTQEITECMAGEILRGILKPVQCPHFGNRCTPEHPMGAPMVSSEGACAAYYHYHHTTASE